MFEFILPDLGEGIAEGEILKWYVEEGAEIGEDEPLVDVETDKAAVTIPSPRGGAVSALNGKVGDVVNVGDVVAVIDDGSAVAVPAEAPAAAASAPAPEIEAAAAPAPPATPAPAPGASPGAPPAATLRRSPTPSLPQRPPELAGQSCCGIVGAVDIAGPAYNFRAILGQRQHHRQGAQGDMHPTGKPLAPVVPLADLAAEMLGDGCHVAQPGDICFFAPGAQPRVLDSGGSHDVQLLSRQ